MPIQTLSNSNRLLASLPSIDRQHILANCEQVYLEFADVLNKPGDLISYAYFPAGCVISLAMPTDNGANLEIGLIGNEGMIGMPLMLGVNIAPFHTATQGAGLALRIAAPLFLQELEHSLEFRRKLKGYLYVSIKQLAQAAACNRFHEVIERLARLLLMISDRAQSEEFHITQELLAQMLGVRRVGVTKAAGSLQQKKLISYRRGNVKIHDLAGLQTVSCECYQADKETYNTILDC